MRSLWPKDGLWRHPDFLRLWAAQSLAALSANVNHALGSLGEMSPRRMRNGASSA